MVSFQVVGLPDQISDPLSNPDHLQTNLILTIQNPDMSRFQIPTIIRREIQTIVTKTEPDVRVGRAVAPRS